jgi:hypothetical protein
MLKVDEDIDAARDDFMRFPPLDMHDEADAAGIVLVLRIVQSLSARESMLHHRPPLQNKTGKIRKKSPSGSEK